MSETAEAAKNKDLLADIMRLSHWTLRWQPQGNRTQCLTRFSIRTFRPAYGRSYKQVRGESGNGWHFMQRDMQGDPPGDPQGDAEYEGMPFRAHRPEPLTDYPTRSLTNSPLPGLTQDSRNDGFALQIAFTDT